MAEMNVRDIQRDIVGTLMNVKDTLGFIRSVHDFGEDGIVVRYLDVRDNNIKDCKFSLDIIKPINGRIGMINDGNGGVYYAIRNPSRKMTIGMDWNNSSLVTVTRPNSEYDLEDVRNFRNKGWIDAFNGSYPTLSKALALAKKYESGCAFDKQFAVDCEGHIYYKAEGIVGVLIGKYKTVKNISWLPGKEHLAIILENDYEKTVRTFQP